MASEFKYDELQYVDGPEYRVHRLRARLRPGRYTLEVVRVTPVYHEYSLRLRVVVGGSVRYEFYDSCKRDEATFDVVEGTKTWKIFRACLVDSHMMMDFLRNKKVYFGKDELCELEGRSFVAEVAISKVDGTNYVRYRTVEPLTYPDCNLVRLRRAMFIKDVMNSIAKLPSI